MPIVKTFHPADPRKIGDKFGEMAPYRKHPHRGLDYSVASGTPLKAVGNGRIVGMGWSDVLGWWLEIRVACVKNGKLVSKYFQYDHLLEDPRKTHKVKDPVAAGAVIAKAGNTGSATTGSHLHIMAGSKPNLHTSPVEDPLPLITEALKGIDIPDPVAAVPKP